MLIGTRLLSFSLASGCRPRRVDFCRIGALAVSLVGASLLGGCEQEQPFAVVSCVTSSDCPASYMCAAEVCIPDLQPGFDVDLNFDVDLDADLDFEALDVDVSLPDSDGGDDPGSTCLDPCNSSRDCIAGDLCVDGCCEPEPVLAPCQRHLDPCRISQESTDRFYCDADERRCLQRCDFDARGASRDCPTGNFCGSELVGGDPNGLNGVCLPSECEPAIDNCGSGQTCIPYPNATGVCTAAGVGAAGQECEPRDGVTTACLPGLICVDSRCTEPCRGACAGGAECLPYFGDDFGTFGVCGTRCAAFGECDGVCSPLFRFDEIAAWVCHDDSDPKQEGEGCRGLDRCDSGLICLDRDAVTGGVCASSCSTTNGEVGPLASCEGDAVCRPTGVREYGVCSDRCAPYPRSGDIGGYGCPTSDDTCRPFVADPTVSLTPEGFCTVETGTSLHGGECMNEGFLGGDCIDFGACFGGQCRQLCEPLSQGQCASVPGTFCSGLEPLFGQVALSICEEATTQSTVGQFCAAADEGLGCADDGSVCLDLGFGPICHRVCAEGFDSVCDVGTTCATGILNPDLVPSYIGLCQ